MDDDSEYEDDASAKPKCPYCGDSEGDCEHVLLDYDATFMGYISGLLAEDSEEIENLKSEILKLLQSGVDPNLDGGFLEEIWEFAKDGYTEDSEDVEFDATAYFNHLNEVIDSYGGEAFSYTDEDGTPGFSSAYVIYFAEDPLKTIRQVNAGIILELGS